MAEDKPRIVACPTCGANVPWLPENRYRPFCNQRCKLIDMGEWAGERYRLPAATLPGEDEGAAGPA